jgi:hypothetical protein
MSQLSRKGQKQRQALTSRLAMSPAREIASCLRYSSNFLACRSPNHSPRGANLKGARPDPPQAFTAATRSAGQEVVDQPHELRRLLHLGHVTILDDGSWLLAGRYHSQRIPRRSNATWQMNASISPPRRRCILSFEDDRAWNILPRKSGSHPTLRWRKADSNRWSQLRQRC